MADLNELESLAKAASSGPWEVGDDGPILYEGMQRPVWNIYGGRNFVDARLVGSIEHFQGDDYPNANAAFIAAANPAVILDLIASARRDAEEIDRLIGYAVHDDTCTTNRFPGQDVCSCGLSSLLQQIRHKQEAADAR